MTRPQADNRYHIVIAGGGNAALCAAIVAASSQSRICILEAAPKHLRGGNTRHTRNMRVAHAAGNGILEGPYPIDEYSEDLLRVTNGNTDPELASLTLEKSAELWDFLAAQGVFFQPALGGTLSLARTNAFFLGGGRSMLNALYLKAEDLGVDIFYNAEIVDLDIDDGFFRSATICTQGDASPDSTTLIEGDAFIAAAGGFEANIEWLKKAWGPGAENFLIRGTRYNRGGVLRLLLDHGVASVGDETQCHAVAIDGRAPKYDGGIVTRLDCVPFGVVLNNQAQRFYDEGEDFWPKRYAIWGRLIAQQPDQIGHVIIDSKSTDLFMPSMFPPAQATNLSDLAVQIDLDPQALITTIDAFNAACQPGDFNHLEHDSCHTTGIVPAKSHWARPINTPPYYAYTLRTGITFTYLGVKVNRKAQVVMDNNKPSTNMYAAGEIMAGNILGEGYLAGIGMTIGSVFGRIAGAAAAQHVKNHQ